MAILRLSGSSQRYLNTATGETISRRQRDKLVNTAKLVEREMRYREKVRARKTAIASIPNTVREANFRYFLQRYSEQYGAYHNMSDAEAMKIALRPGSMFHRLWAQAEVEGFSGGVNSAWDALAQAAGAKGGAENEHERSKYLAVIQWEMRHRIMARQEWIKRDASGLFVRGAA